MGGMVRVTAVSAGAVDYLLRGCDCDEHTHPDQDQEQSPEREQRLAAERAAGRDASEYFAAAVGHGEPAGVWLGSGAGALGLDTVAGTSASEADIRAILGQLERPEHRDPEGQVTQAAGPLGSRPRRYKTAEQIAEAAKAREPDASPERLREIEREAGRSARQATAYYDVTCSAPKSVSVYWSALLAAGASEDAAKVVGAHDKAVEIALAYAERHIAYTRTGWHGRATGDGESIGKYEQAEGVLAAAFRHSTSRANDPQLHTHLAILNRLGILRPDGTVHVGALDGKAFAPIKEAIATAYGRALEQLITEATGARFAMRPDGKAREIIGIDPDLIREGSTRRGQVDQRVAEYVAEYEALHGREPGPQARKRMADMAVKDTRQAKTAESGPAAAAAWGQARGPACETSLDAVADAAMAAADAVMTGPDTATRERTAQLAGVVIDPATGAARDITTGEPVDAATVTQRAREAGLAAAAAVGVADVQAKYATWTLGNLVHAIDDHLGDDAAALGVPADQRAGVVEQLARDAVAHGNRAGVLLVSAPDPVQMAPELQREDGRSIYRRANHERYATTAHLGLEDRLLAGARETSAATVTGPDLEIVAIELTAAGLSEDQVAAVTGVLSSGRAADVLVGPAGAGKSHTVGQLAHAWTQAHRRPDGQGGRVIGTATAEIATRNLAGDGLEAINTTKFLHDFVPDPATGQARDRLGPGDLVVVDEAGMSSTGQLAAIFDLARAAGAKVLFIGDHHQLAAVEAGGMFARLVEVNGAHELEVVHRFEQAWEGPASLRLRAGDVAAVEEYTDRGRLRSGSLEAMQEAATRGYLADTLAGKTSLLIVGSNQHADELSTSIRQRLVELGVVGTVPVGELAGGQRVSVGDRIQARRNDYGLRVDPAVGPDGHAGPAMPVTNRETYTVTGRDPATGDLLAVDRHGATVHLARDYVREHVSLAYAVTNHAAQGVTVDTGHPILDRDATREAAYPATTRGRESNIIYLVTKREPDPHEAQHVRENPAERFAAILATSGAENAAGRVRDLGRADAASLATVGTLWDAVAGEYARAHYSADLDALLVAAVGPDRAAAAAQEPGRDRLLRTVREAELAGHHPTTLMREAVLLRRWESAESVTETMRHRVSVRAQNRQPEQTVTPGDWAAYAPPLDGPVGETAQELAVLAADRQAQLGADTATTSPEWALQALGEVPDGVTEPAARADWEQRAGRMAAYRELANIPADQTSLGAAPSREHEFHRAAWRAAVDAATPQTETDEQAKVSGRDVRAMADAELYTLREQWARTHEQAPPWVSDQLEQAHRLGHQHRVDARLATAELAMLGPDDPRRPELAAHLERAERLAGHHDARIEALEAARATRAQWYRDTTSERESAVRAGAELDARHLPLERDGTTSVDRSRDALVDLLGVHRADDLDGHGYSKLRDALRDAEAAGHDPRAVLGEVIDQRSLRDADSIDDVLTWRIERHLPDRTPDLDTQPAVEDEPVVEDQLVVQDAPVLEAGPAEDYPELDAEPVVESDPADRAERVVQDAPELEAEPAVEPEPAGDDDAPELEAGPLVDDDPVSDPAPMPEADRADDDASGGAELAAAAAAAKEAAREAAASRAERAGAEAERARQAEQAAAARQAQDAEADRVRQAEAAERDRVPEPTVDREPDPEAEPEPELVISEPVAEPEPWEPEQGDDY